MFTQLKERFRKKILDNMLVALIGSEEKNSTEIYQTDENIKKILDECKERVYVFRRDMKSTELFVQLMGQKKNMQDKQESEKN